MRKIVTRAQAIEYAIFAFILIAVITIFPLRLWHETIISSGNEHPAGKIEVGGEAVCLQQFYPEYNHIDTIEFRIGEGVSEGEYCLRVFDKNFALLREMKKNTKEIQNFGQAGYASVYINLDCEVGEAYYYTLEGVSCVLPVEYEVSGNSGMVNHGYLQHNGEVIDACNIVTKYDYSQPIRKTKSLVLILGLILAGVIAKGIIDSITKKQGESGKLSELCTISWIVKLIGNPLVVIGTVVALIYTIPLHKFSIFIADMIVLPLGIVLLAITLLYLINRDFSADNHDPLEYLQNNFQNILQALCIALALWACINYMNGLYEIHHDIAWRKMTFYIGLSMIVTFGKKELFRIYNLVLLVAALITAQVYYVQNLPDMVDEFHVAAMKMTCYNFPIIFMMIGYIIRQIVLLIMYISGRRNDENEHFGKILGKISWPYFVLSLALMTGILLRRYTRTWPVIMAVCFGVFAFRTLFWKDRKNLLGNIANGILMHFFGCMIYCLWHRPHEAYEYARYPFVFHTVTITACYLSLVVAVALVKFLHRYNETRRIKDCIAEMLMLGCTASYLLFTMSRTGMLAVIAAGGILWLTMITGKKGKLRHLLISAGTILISIIWCFPICFTLQKTVPGLVGEPRLMIIESYPMSILVSEDLDSDDYITFGRFTQVFLHKMLSMPEHKIKINDYTILGKNDESKEMLLVDNEGNILSEEQYAAWGNGEEYLTENNEEYVDVSEESADEAVEISDAAEGLEETAQTEEQLDAVFVPEENPTIESLYDENGKFAPPHEFREEGEPPQEWYDEDYWFYNPANAEWEFATWMLEEEAADSDVSNGRTDIYRAYLEQMTKEGHEEMGAILPDGSEAAHAHDIYLQVAYDHGIIVGVLFILWVIMTCVQALIVFMRRKSFDPSAGVVLAVSVIYAMAGVTEWISHPCNPVGCIILPVAIALALMGKENE